MKGKGKAWIVVLAVVIVAACGAAVFFLTADLNSWSAFSISKFGAVPGEGKEDTVAIQNAINAALDGGTVYLSKGVYDVKTLHIKKNVKLQGKGREDTVLKFTGSPGIQEIIRMDSADGVELKGFAIDGQDGKLLLCSASRCSATTRPCAATP